MKRFVSLLLILLCILSLFSCEDADTNASSDPSADTSSAPEESIDQEILPIDPLYVFDICEGEFSEDSLKETIADFQAYGKPYEVERGKDISFNVSGKVKSANVQCVRRADGDDADDEIRGGIYLLVNSTLDSDDELSTVTVDTDWWYDMADGEPSRACSLWSYVVHIEYADGTNSWLYLRAHFRVQDTRSITYEGRISYYTAHSQELAATFVDGGDAEFVLYLLNHGKWNEGICKCASDCVISVGETRLEYSLSCNTINDVTNDRFMTITDGSQTLFSLLAILNLYDRAAVLYTAELDSDELTNDDIGDAIVKYKAKYPNVQPVGANQFAALDVADNAISASISRISSIDEADDISHETTSYLDLWLEPIVKNGYVLIPSDWWYSEDSWINNYTKWSYLVRVKCDDGETRYYYARAEFTK